MDEQQQQALDVVVRLLAGREHSRHELQQKLLQRGFTSTDASAAISHAAERGWQSDTRYAEMWVRHCLQKGHGASKVRAAAQQRGIARELIDEALQHADPDWDDACYRRLLKRFGQQPPLEAKQRDKMIRHLLSQGFTYGQIKQALERQSAAQSD
ncbi:MAG: Regulatory protein RecX [Pseudidiomarina mangrovi]|nr:MAG: Regulatory protein RecX [Pseudidiomarina mangrovi]